MVNQTLFLAAFLPARQAGLVKSIIFSFNWKKIDIIEVLLPIDTENELRPGKSSLASSRVRGSPQAFA